MLEEGYDNKCVNGEYSQNMVENENESFGELGFPHASTIEIETDEGAAGDARQQRVVVKFLVPNVAVGSIIGKAGSSITAIQNHSGARVQISKSNEFYPDTSNTRDRILLISGTVGQLLLALHHVLTKLKSEPIAMQAIQSKSDGRLQLRMLVHTRLCGNLIGKGGATIRSFNEDSKATFSVSPPPTLPGLTERIVHIAGDVDELMRAVALVVTKLSQNPDFHILTDANLVYSARYVGGPGASGYVQHPANTVHTSARGSGGSAITTSIVVAIPESRVGSVIGKEGSVLNQIKELLNVTVRISPKGEHIPGTSDRFCYITGEGEAVEMAQRLIMRRIEGIQ